MERTSNNRRDWQRWK